MHAGFYLWPKRFRHVGLIVAVIAALFWFKQLTSFKEIWESQTASPEATCRIIERELLALDIANDSNGFLQWYLGWEDREATLRIYSSILSETSFETEDTERLQDQIKERLTGKWPTPTETDSSYLTQIFIGESFFIICVLCSFLFGAHFFYNRNNPNIHKPPLPWFSVGWVLMIFFLAELFSNSISTELYLLMYERGIYSNTLYILADGFSQAMVPLLICGISFSRLEHFKKKFFPDFTIHWKVIFFASGCTYIVSYLLSYILPTPNDFLDLGPIDPTPEYLIYIFLSAVIFAPLFEEITFRGFLFQGLRHKLGFFTAAIVTSILFASIHVQYDWIDMIYVGIGGFAGCWVTYRTGSLVSGIVLHALHNLACFVSFYFCYQQPL